MTPGLVIVHLLAEREGISRADRTNPPRRGGGRRVRLSAKSLCIGAKIRARPVVTGEPHIRQADPAQLRVVFGMKPDYEAVRKPGYVAQRYINGRATLDDTEQDQGHERDQA